MTTLDVVTFFVYLVGSVTFILGLKFLASPVSARRGNRLAATGMAIVVEGPDGRREIGRASCRERVLTDV